MKIWRIAMPVWEDLPGMIKCSHGYVISRAGDPRVRSYTETLIRWFRQNAPIGRAGLTFAHFVAQSGSAAEQACSYCTSVLMYSSTKLRSLLIYRPNPPRGCTTSAVYLYLGSWPVRGLMYLSLRWYTARTRAAVPGFRRLPRFWFMVPARVQVLCNRESTAPAGLVYPGTCS